MTTTAKLYPSSGAFVSSPGSAGWDNADGIVSVNDQSATVASGSLGGGDVSRKLRATNFAGMAAAIPDGATIDGIEVYVEGISGGSEVYSVQLRKAGADAGAAIVSTGTNVGNTPYGHPIRKLGSTTQLWGTTWSKADLINTGFGLDLRIANPDPENSIGTQYVDALSVAVTYTPSAIAGIRKRLFQIGTKIGTMICLLMGRLRILARHVLEKLLPLRLMRRTY